MPRVSALTDDQLDRVRGVLIGLAAGDALGAPYEFGSARGPELPIEMSGGGGLNWEPGEWTDDTSMAIVIARVAADGLDLLSTPTQAASSQPGRIGHCQHPMSASRRVRCSRSPGPPRR